MLSGIRRQSWTRNGDARAGGGECVVRNLDTIAVRLHAWSGPVRILRYRDGAEYASPSWGAPLVHWKEAGIHCATGRTPFHYYTVKILSLGPFNKILRAPGY